MKSTDLIKTIIITNDPGIAVDAEKAGVNRIMVDLEVMGKKERQASRATFISTHQKEDIAKIRAVLRKTELIVRINPWHSGSPAEIDQAVRAGADIVMLPMITSMEHLDAFLEHLGTRARPMPLIETAYSMAHIDDIAANKAIDEMYIGLNDLHLSLGLDFLFEPLALGLIDWMATQIKSYDKAFGFGGMAAMRSGELPAERVLAEHVRLGSRCVILSSRFGKDINITETQGREQRLSDALMALQGEYHILTKRSQSQQHADSKRTMTMIKALADAARKRNAF